MCNLPEGQSSTKTHITMHISKLEILVCSLKRLDQEIDNEMLMSKILSTLPVESQHFITKEFYNRNDMILNRNNIEVIADVNKFLILP